MLAGSAGVVTGNPASVFLCLGTCLYIYGLGVEDILSQGQLKLLRTLIECSAKLPYPAHIR